MTRAFCGKGGVLAPLGEEEQIPILYLVWSMGVGGAEKLACDMLRWLPRNRFRPVICSIGYGGVLGDLLKSEGYPVYHRKTKPGIDLPALFWLREILRRERIRVIHAHQYNPMCYAGLAAAGNRPMTVVYTEHGRIYPESRKWKRSLLNPLLSCGLDHLVSIAESTRRAMIRYDNFPARKVRVIHNGVDTHRFGGGKDLRAKRLELGIPPGCKVVGTAARLEKIKNLPMMLRAFRMVVEKRPDTVLLVAGTGSGEEDLKALAGELGIGSKVVFAGLRNDLPEVFPLLDVFLLSSFTEGISVTLLEAMMCGVPAVVTDVGGNPEVVLDGVTGYLVPSGEEQAMAVRTLALLEAPERAAEMGRLGRERIATRFTFQRMMNEYLSLYGTA